MVALDDKTMMEIRMKKVWEWFVNQAWLMTSVCLSPLAIMGVVCNRQDLDMAALFGGILSLGLMTLITVIDDRVR